jgi:hypothetical protein
MTLRQVEHKHCELTRWHMDFRDLVKQNRKPLVSERREHRDTPSRHYQGIVTFGTDSASLAIMALSQSGNKQADRSGGDQFSANQNNRA